MYGGDGDVDFIIGGSSDDMIYADNSSSTNNGNRDIVFGDHGEIVFYDDESHKVEQATTIDAGCNGGSDVITLGSGDDLVSFITLF